MKNEPDNFPGLIEAGQWHKIKVKPVRTPLFHTIGIVIILLVVRDPLPFTSFKDVFMCAAGGIAWMWAYWMWLRLYGDTFTVAKEPVKNKIMIPHLNSTEPNLQP